MILVVTHVRLEPAGHVRQLWGYSVDRPGHQRHWDAVHLALLVEHQQIRVGTPTGESLILGATGLDSVSGALLRLPAPTPQMLQAHIPLTAAGPIEEENQEV